MANVAKTIEIIFAGSDKVSGTISDIGSNLETFGTDLQNIGAPFADAAEKVLLLEAALVALVAGGLTYATIKAGEFSEGMSEINTLLDTSGPAFETYGQDVLEYSLKSTASMEDLQLALYNLISLGGDYSTSLEGLATIEKLSVATKTDLTSGTETLIGTMNAYGAKIEEAGDYSDAFFTIIRDGKTTLPELSVSIAQVTGIAATAGIDFETLGSSIAAMTASGAPTSQAITSIKAAIQAMVAPTKLTTDAAKAFGIELGQSAIKSKGFEVVLKEIYDAANGDLEVMKTMIPSIEGLSAVSILGADSAGILAKALVDMSKNTGATEEAFDKMKNNLSLNWQTMLNNFNSIFIKMGLSLGDGSTELINGFADLFGAIGKGFDTGEFNDISTFINKFVTEITDSISSIAENISKSLEAVDFSELITSFETVVEEIKNLFTGFDIDITTVDGLSTAIQLVVDSIESLQNVTSGIVSAFAPIVSAGIYLIEMLNDLDDETKKLVGEILGFGAQLTIIGSILGVSGILVSGIGSLVTGIGALGGLFTGGGILATGLTAIITLLTGPVGLAIAVTAVGTAVINFSMRNVNKELEELTEIIGKNKVVIDGFIDKINELPDVSTSEIFIKIESGEYEEALILIKEAQNKQHTIDIKTELDTKNFNEFTGSWNEIVDKDINLAAKINEGSFDDVEATLSKIDDKNIDITATTNIDTIKEELSWFDEDGKRHTILVDVETKNLDETKDKIEKLPTEKMLEIKLQGEIDTTLQKIISQADIVQTAMEWEAKLDIAEAEAVAEIITSAFEAAGEAVSSTASATADMFGDLTSTISDLSTMDKWFLQDILREQMDLEKAAIELQSKLTIAQTEYLEAKTEAMERGDSLITISSDGLEPALETIMWQVIEKVQVRANAEAADFLLGVA